MMAGFNAFDPEEIFKNMAHSVEAEAASEAAAAPMMSAYAALRDAGFSNKQAMLMITAILRLTSSEEVKEWLRAEGLIE